MPELNATMDEIESGCNSISEHYSALLQVSRQQTQTIRQLRESLQTLRVKLNTINQKGKSRRMMSGVMRSVRTMFTRRAY